MRRFRDRYRIESTRLKGWDYTTPGFYFITICSRDRRPYFGKIVNGQVQTTPLGKIARDFWTDLPQHFPYLRLDEFVVMPNHVHGILVLESGVVETPVVETQHAASLPMPPNVKPGSVSAMVRSYKSAVTRWACRNGYPDFGWQARFYDHIIRDEKSLGRIRAYIRENPLKWETDKNFIHAK